jgi:hypothetical protein
MGRKGSGGEAENLGARLKVHTCPSFFHDAGAFHAKARPSKAIHQHIFRQKPLGPHHIAEIQPRRRDTKPYLTGAGFWQDANAPPAQACQLPRLFNGKSARKSRLGGWQAWPQKRFKTARFGKAYFRRVTGPFGE